MTVEAELSKPPLKYRNAMKKAEQELAELAEQWREKIGSELVMRIDWQAFWKDADRSEQETEEALRYMVNCGTERLIKSYCFSGDNPDFSDYREAFSVVKEYQLVWVANSEDVRLQLEDDILKDFFNVEGFIQYYASLEKFIENKL